MRQTFFSLSLAVILTATAGAQSFIHPGGLHTQADLERMRTKVAAGEHPWIDGWNALTRDRKAQSDYKAAPNAHMGSRQQAQDDASAAYLNALRWQISGDKAYANCAVRIFNDWAGTVNEKPQGPDQPGLSGIPIGTFAIAAELARTYPGWAAADQANCLTASLSNDGVVQLNWKNAPDSTRAGIKVEAAIKDAPFYEIADLTADATRFNNTGLQNPTDLRYRLRAYNRGGYSNYSNPAQCEQ